jgi:hypothetical protein
MRWSVRGCEIVSDTVLRRAGLEFEAAHAKKEMAEQLLVLRTAEN